MFTLETNLQQRRSEQMIMICHHDNETLDRICCVCERPAPPNLTAPERDMIGIDEETLAWLYIAPGYEQDRATLQLIHSALELIGPEAWTVIQAAEQDREALCEASGLRIVESYLNQAPEPLGVSVHLAQTAPR